MGLLKLIEHPLWLGSENADKEPQKSLILYLTGPFFFFFFLQLPVSIISCHHHNKT